MFNTCFKNYESLQIIIELIKTPNSSIDKFFQVSADRNLNNEAYIVKYMQHHKKIYKVWEEDDGDIGITELLKNVFSIPRIDEEDDDEDDDDDITMITGGTGGGRGSGSIGGGRAVTVAGRGGRADSIVGNIEGGSGNIGGTSGDIGGASGNIEGEDVVGASESNASVPPEADNLSQNSSVPPEADSLSQTSNVSLSQTSSVHLSQTSNLSLSESTNLSEDVLSQTSNVNLSQDSSPGNLSTSSFPMNSNKNSSMSYTKQPPPHDLVPPSEAVPIAGFEMVEVEIFGVLYFYYRKDGKAHGYNWLMNNGARAKRMRV